MDPASWNHQQDPREIDCALEKHHHRFPRMYLGRKRLPLRIPPSSQRCQSHRIVHLHVRSAVAQELPSLCGALPPSFELPRRRAKDHLFSNVSDKKRRHRDLPFWKPWTIDGQECWNPRTARRTGGRPHKSSAMQPSGHESSRGRPYVGAELQVG